MTTAWSHLPNAAYIDRVLADVSANPKKWSDAYDAAWSDARDAARSDAWDAAWNARGAVLALVAYDDCAHLLDGNPEHVHLMALLGSDAAILLYPACVALNKQLELA